MAILLLCSFVILGGCGTQSNVKIESNKEEPSQTIAVKETKANATVKPEDSPTTVKTPTPTTAPTVLPDENVMEEVNKDLDSNGVNDQLQIISLKDGTETRMHVYLNKKQIFEYEDPSSRLMGVNAFEYLDIDQDGSNEIFITASTDANSRELVDVLCLKLMEGNWKQMDLPLNDSGNNGFSYKVTRGKNEFDFIVSSDTIKQEICINASQLFVNDESGNIDSIQAFRKNNYKQGDKIDSSLGWGISAAKIGTYEGRNCVIATEGLEVPYGHGLGDINTYFAYNKKGILEILKVEFLPY